MKKVSFTHSLLMASILVVSTSSAVLANEENGSERTTYSATETEIRKPTKVEIEALRALQTKHLKERVEAAKQVERLDSTKKQKCQQAEAKIGQHTSNFTVHIQRQLQVFENISQKVRDFATKKNLTVAQEQALLAQIQAAKDKVVATLSTLKTDSSSFRCDGTNPKGTLKSFQTGAALARSDLKAYRDSVRELIKAVRAANGETTKTGVSQ